MEQIEEESFHFKHVAVIMDGNRRWARLHNLDLVEGHKAGSKVFKESIEWCIRLGIKEYSVYAFSCENWNRTYKEVNDLMELFSFYTNEVIESMDKEADSIYNQVKLQFIGRHILSLWYYFFPLSERDHFSSELLNSMVRLEERSKDHSLLKVNVCLDYSGQWDIAQSCQKLITQYHSEFLLDEKNPSDLSVEEVMTKLAGNLSTGDSPVDVVIRTGGEYRISNFLLWQIAYAEIYILDDFWPDFTFAKFKEALAAVNQRNRRFGK